MASDKKKLRSAEWFGKSDKDGFLHRSWMKNQGIPADEFDGRPVIGICNTWSELTPCNAHLRGIAERVKRGVYEAGHDVETTSYPLWTIDHETISRLADEGGIVAPTGPAGSGLFFHCNLVHGSPSNMTPWGRTIV